MNTLTLKIPTSLQMNEFELGMIVASRLFDEGKLSSGQAAEMVGISKRAFLEIVGKYVTPQRKKIIPQIRRFLRYKFQKL